MNLPVVPLVIVGWQAAFPEQRVTQSVQPQIRDGSDVQRTTLVMSSLPYLVPPYLAHPNNAAFNTAPEPQRLKVDGNSQTALAPAEPSRTPLGLCAG